MVKTKHSLISLKKKECFVEKSLSKLLYQELSLMILKIARQHAPWEF